ncbi:peptide chain release factor N(5)-glutamine methyltransferase [Clostridiaceae bacterium DONG20-135]|uniref:Release factor glutamine methyltransferase n=1 Tax=Copranaerobaculum intestinale TaxID=2692629 RepID=A0A6N8U5I8_9FIRM|nr:peptide chain release factor N(5)-glutamine methyltransferase [Copranaerobaculum intestinale]MXQ72584.1 peptide chain release factor N(5)-glutamine methyltransferase [Copranaerobaculum intestinale]
MASYKQSLRAAEKQLQNAECGEQAAFMLLLELAQMEAHNLYMEFDQEIPDALNKQFQEGIARLAENEPLAHILGYEWFYGYRFLVNEDVLIPRPETEELVANILSAYDDYFKMNGNIIAADIGTGSGAIAISLKKEEPSLHVLATDISKKAVDVAARNAELNEVSISFCIGDMLEPLIDRDLKVDILISNPPYIPQEEILEASVKDHEPHVALFGGDDGLKYYRIMFEKAKQVLKPRSMMAFEMGWNQREALLNEVKRYFPDACTEVLKDMNGKDRMLFVYFGIQPNS